MEFVKILEKKGWCEANVSASCQQAFEEELLVLAMHLGAPVSSRARGSVVEKLTPLRPENANPRSLSKQFGTGVFPLHTDCAHWTQPPRYVVLASRKKDQSGSATILLDAQDLNFSANEQQDVFEGLFMASNGRRSFFCSIHDIENRFIRFDPGCMKPQNDSAIRAMDVYSVNHHLNRLHEICWSPGQAIIIDNWRMLHGRTAVSPSVNNREIWRVLVQ